MATVLTGNQITLDITGVGSFTPQVTSVTVDATPNRQVIELLGGPTYKTTETPYTVSFEMVLDWGVTTSLAQALTDEAVNSPNTSIVFTAVATGTTHDTTVSGRVFPEIVPVTGTGAAIATTSVTLTGDPNYPLTVVTATI